MDNLPAKRGRKLGGTLEHVRQRRTEVTRLYLKGKSRQYILEDISTRFKVSKEQVTLDLLKVYADLKEVFEKEKENIMVRHINMYYEIYNNCETIDPSNQIKAFNSVEKLLKLGSPESAIQVNNLSLNLENLTVEELKKLLNPNDETK